MYALRSENDGRVERLRAIKPTVQRDWDDISWKRAVKYPREKYWLEISCFILY